MGIQHLMRWFKIMSVKGFDSPGSFMKVLDCSFGRRKVILHKIDDIHWHMEVE